MITRGFGFESEEYISSRFYNTTDIMTKINVDEIRSQIGLFIPLNNLFYNGIDKFT